MDPTKVMLTEDAAARLCRANFKGYFICEGHKLLKMNEDRSTDDDHNNPNKSHNSNNLLMPSLGYQWGNSGLDQQ